MAIKVWLFNCDFFFSYNYLFKPVIGIPIQILIFLSAMLTLSLGRLGVNRRFEAYFKFPEAHVHFCRPVNHFSRMPTRFVANFIQKLRVLFVLTGNLVPIFLISHEI